MPKKKQNKAQNKTISQPATQKNTLPQPTSQPKALPERKTQNKSVREPTTVLCDTEASVLEAVSVLKTCQTVIVDCEGDNLGRQGGRLSLIAITTTPLSNGRTFVIDAVVLTPSVLTNIFEILRSESVVKVLFDGRMDFLCLYRDFGVTTRNVIDLQLADVRSRQINSNEADRLKRLWSFVAPSTVSKNRRLFDQIHKISGLAECAKEHKLPVSKKLPVDHSKWMVRPLSPGMLAYTARDVYVISMLYEKFAAGAQLNNLEKVKDISFRYITMWQSTESPENECTGHCLFPLDIFPSPPPGPRRRCNGCNRSLSESAFIGAQTRCRVCSAFDLRLPRKAKGAQSGSSQPRARGSVSTALYYSDDSDDDLSALGYDYFGKAYHMKLGRSGFDGFGGCSFDDYGFDDYGFDDYGFEEWDHGFYDW